MQLFDIFHAMFMTLIHIQSNENVESLLERKNLLYILRSEDDTSHMTMHDLIKSLRHAPRRRRSKVVYGST